jgi:hypothetical protein
MPPLSSSKWLNSYSLESKFWRNFEFKIEMPSRVSRQMFSFMANKHEDQSSFTKTDSKLRIIFRFQRPLVTRIFCTIELCVCERDRVRQSFKTLWVLVVHMHFVNGCRNERHRFVRFIRDNAILLKGVQTQENECLKVNTNETFILHFIWLLISAEKKICYEGVEKIGWF